MSEKQQDNQAKKSRLGRGLGSLLGGGLNSVSSEQETVKKTEAIQVPINSSVTQNKTQIVAQQSVVQSAVKQNAEVSVSATVANAVAAPIAPQIQQQIVPPESRIWKIAVDKLNPNEYQPRQKFNKDTLNELAASIKEKGILQPIVARRHLNGTFEIISGERRWRAAQSAGLHEVPVILRSVTDQDSLELAIIENVQREDLNPIDEAEAYQRLADEFKLTQQQIADKVGKERATVANALRLLALPLQVREMLGKQELSVGHAKVLLSLPDAKTISQLAKKVVNDKISVRALEKLIQSMLKENTLDDEDDNIGEKAKIKNRLAEAAGLEMQRLIGTKVVVDYNSGKGKITLSFYSDEEFNEMTEKLKKAWQK